MIKKHIDRGNIFNQEIVYSLISSIAYSDLIRLPKNLVRLSFNVKRYSIGSLFVENVDFQTSEGRIIFYDFDSNIEGYLKSSIESDKWLSGLIYELSQGFHKYDVLCLSIDLNSYDYYFTPSVG